MRIAIDAGHGGKDPGCHGQGLVEKEVALDLAQRLGHLLRAEGISCVLTRQEDCYVAISQRARMACQAKADALISLHMDWSPNSSARGMTAYVVEGDSRSEKLAKAVLEGGHPEMAKRIPRNGVHPDTRARVGRLGVLRGCYRQMPALLLECGFLSNSQDAALLHEPQFRQDLCRGFARALISSIEGSCHELA